MTGATLEELRELSRRSRSTQRWAMLGLLGVLLLVPLQVLLQAWLPLEWLAAGIVVVGGLLMLRYAYAAGQERGAYRKVFARLKEERRTRTIVPSGPEKRDAPALARGQK